MKKIIVVLFSWFATANLWAFDNVKLSLDWVPQGEHGGYFQAIAKGYYAEHNIELEIIPGGPSVNTKAMLMSDQEITLSKICHLQLLLLFFKKLRKF